MGDHMKNDENDQTPVVNPDPTPCAPETPKTPEQIADDKEQGYGKN